MMDAPGDMILAGPRFSGDQERNVRDGDSLHLFQNALHFGLVGYISAKLKFHPAPIVLGLILGPFVEEGLVQSMLAGKAAGSVLKYMVFRPVSLVLIALCLMSALWPLYAGWRAKRRKPFPSLPLPFSFARSGNRHYNIRIQGGGMAAKIIAIEEQDGPFQAVLQRTLRMIPDRQREDKNLQRLIAFRLRRDGEAQTQAYLIHKIRDIIQCGYAGNWYNYFKGDAGEKADKSVDPNGSPPDVA